MFSRLKNLFKKKEVFVPIVIILRVRPPSTWANQPRPVMTPKLDSESDGK